MSRKNYLVYGHTAKGFRSLLPTNLQTLNKLYVLKGGPAQIRSDIMKYTSSRPELSKCSQEYLHSPLNPDTLDGVLFPGLGIGIVDGTSLSDVELAESNPNVEYVELGEFMDEDKIFEYTDVIQDIQHKMQECCEKAYESFAKGIKVHDEWEKIYISNMNFNKANELTEEVYNELLGSSHFDKDSCVKHRFFGGSTPSGPMDYVEDLTKNISDRYFIKGRPGSGKSTMLKKLQRKAQDHGIDVEVYHCGFDPDSLDMLLFPELNLCIFDSTSPHEYYPSRDGDSIIDMYEKLITPGTDETHEAELIDIVSRYKSFTKEGTAHLADAKHYYDMLEKLYIESSDLKAMEKIQEELSRAIVKIFRKDVTKASNNVSNK